METLPWGKLFETGHMLIDFQHKRLVDLTNQFGSLLADGKFSAADFEEVYQELVSYTQYHFDEEERLMRETCLDMRHVELHQQEHEDFVKNVLQLRAEVEEGDRSNATVLFEFLLNWLVYHILGSDAEMARQIAAVQKGMAAAQAYDAQNTAPETATDLLLGSLSKLFHHVSLRNRQLAELNESLEQKVQVRTRELLAANQCLEKMATTDVLTGLPNRRYAINLLTQLWDQADVRGLSCMLIDADGFKAINDNYGHDAGDLVLRQLARELSYAVRTDDVVCRLGGDEFLIICPRTDIAGALHIAALTQAQIAALSVPVNGGCWHGSISVGVASRRAAMSSPDELIKEADRAVYQAKKAGKNCVRASTTVQPVATCCNNQP